jgi:hypothetical protein
MDLNPLHRLEPQTKGMHPLHRIKSEHSKAIYQPT